MLDKFVELANSNSLPEDALINESPHSFYEGLAIASNLIYLDSNGYYQNDIRDYFNPCAYSVPIQQKQTKTTRGSSNEWNLSFGANINDLIYLGAAFGVRTIRYEENTTFEERDVNNNVSILNGYSFNQDLMTSGVGVNFKL